MAAVIPTVDAGADLGVEVLDGAEGARLAASVAAAGRQPRRRIADLLTAATAVSHGLALYTTNPDDFVGLEEYLQVVPVTRPRTGP